MIIDDLFYLKIALREAKLAGECDEVPVGACLVSKTGKLIAASGNRTISDLDPTAHAEILVIRQAAKKLGNYRLTGCTLYTTIEPCVMCAGAAVNARINRLVFGAADERFGAVISRFRICDGGSLNHEMEIVFGIMENDCGKLMQDFFRQKRSSG